MVIYHSVLRQLFMLFLLQIRADSLATLGLFTYLGRKTRMFLSAMGIKDLDGVVKDFLRLISLHVCYILNHLNFQDTYGEDSML